MAGTPLLAELLRRPDIWRGDAAPELDASCVPSGNPELDAELPGGGWPRGVLIEFLLKRDAGGELPLLLPSLLQAVQGDGWLAVIAPTSFLPYAPGWARAGIDLRRLLIIQAARADAAWCCEQLLDSGAFAAVLAWLPHADAGVLRRLNLAQGRHHSLAFVFRPIACASQASPAPLRVLLEAAQAGQRGAQTKNLTLRLLKRRGRPHALPLYVPVLDPLSGRELPESRLVAPSGLRKSAVVELLP